MSAKRKWTQEETDRLHTLVEDAVAGGGEGEGEGAGALDEAAWQGVATALGRTVKACRERYAAPASSAAASSAPSSSSTSKPPPWSLPEERLLFQLQSSSLGNSWTAISACLPGRLESSVKNRYYSALRRVERAFRCSPEAAAGMLSAYARSSATAEEAAAVAAVVEAVARGGGVQHARPGRVARSAERSGQAEAGSGGEGGEEGGGAGPLAPSTAVLLARARAAPEAALTARGRRVQFEDAVLEAGRPGEGAAAPSGEGSGGGEEAEVAALPTTAPRRAAPRRSSGQQQREERAGGEAEADSSPPHPATRLTALLVSLDAGGGAGSKRERVAMSVADSAAHRGRAMPARVGEEEEEEAPRAPRATGRAKRGRRGGSDGGGSGAYRAAALPSVLSSSASSSSMGLGTLRLGLPEGPPPMSAEALASAARLPPFPPASEWEGQQEQEGGLPSRPPWGVEGGSGPALLQSLASLRGGTPYTGAGYGGGGESAPPPGGWGGVSQAGSSFAPGWPGLLPATAAAAAVQAFAGRAGTGSTPAPSPSTTASTAYASALPALGGRPRLAGYSDALRPPASPVPPLPTALSPGMRPGLESAGVRVAAVPLAQRPSRLARSEGAGGAAGEEPQPAGEGAAGAPSDGARGPAWWESA